MRTTGLYTFEGLQADLSDSGTNVDPEVRPALVSDTISSLLQETEPEYGNLQLKHPPVGRRTSK